jgi:hypothetical protein
MRTWRIRPVAGSRLLVVLSLALVALLAGACERDVPASPSTSSGTTLAIAPVTSISLVPSSSAPTSVPATTPSSTPGLLPTKGIDGWALAVRADMGMTSPPVVEAGRTLWVDRQEPGPSKIMLYDSAAGSVSTLATLDGMVGTVALSSDDVLYSYDSGDGRSAVYLLPISTGETRQISGDDWAGNPFFHDGYAVWSEYNPGPPDSWEYVYYDLRSQQSAVMPGLSDGNAVTSALTRLDDDDNWVVWMAIPQSIGDPAFMAYSIADHAMHDVPIALDDRFDALDGDLVYYSPGNGGDLVDVGQPEELRVCNLVTGTNESVVTEDHGVQWTTADAGRVAWASWDDAGRFIKILDTATGKTTRLDIPGYQVGQLQLRGDLLLWHGQRASPKATLGSAAVFVYDLRSGVATRLSSTLSMAGWAETDGSLVCFGQTPSRAGQPYAEVEFFVRTPDDAFAFADVFGTHPYRTAVAGLASLGAFAASSGTGADVGALFLPDDPATVGDVCEWLAASLDLQPHDDPVEALARVGLFASGAPSAEALARRSQLIDWIVRVGALLRPGLLSAYTGYPGTDEDFHKTGDAVAAQAEWSGLLDGVVDYYSKTWDPSAPATRGEAAQIIWNLASSEDGPLRRPIP